MTNRIVLTATAIIPPEDVPARPATVTVEGRTISVPGAQGAILAAVLERVLKELGVQVLDVTQTREGSLFAMMILADRSASDLSIDSLRRTMDEVGRQISATVRIQGEDLFRYMHRL